jgi:hypothetical protein
MSDLAAMLDAKHLHGAESSFVKRDGLVGSRSDRVLPLDAHQVSA